MSRVWHTYAWVSLWMHQFTNTYCLLAAGFLRIVDGQKLEQAIDERSQEGDCDCNVCVCVCWHGQVYGSIWCLLTRIVIVSFVLSVTGSCKHSCLWSSLCFIWGWAKYPRQQHWSSSSDPLLPKENLHRNWTISERGVNIESLFYISEPNRFRRCSVNL